MSEYGGEADLVKIDAVLQIVRAFAHPAASAVAVTVTAWQMLHRVARVRAGQTVLVHGAAGGVGTLLVQLARRAGARVIGTASPAKHDRVGALGATPLDYPEPGLADRVRELAPGGVAAVFDHVAGPGLRESWRTLGRGGVHIVYGSAGTLDDHGWQVALERAPLPLVPGDDLLSSLCRVNG